MADRIIALIRRTKKNSIKIAAINELIRVPAIFGSNTDPVLAMAFDVIQNCKFRGVKIRAFELINVIVHERWFAEPENLRNAIWQNGISVIKELLKKCTPDNYDVLNMESVTKCMLYIVKEERGNMRRMDSTEMPPIKYGQTDFVCSYFDSMNLGSAHSYLVIKAIELHLAVVGHGLDDTVKKSMRFIAGYTTSEHIGFLRCAHGIIGRLAKDKVWEKYTKDDAFFCAQVKCTYQLIICFARESGFLLLDQI